MIALLAILGAALAVGGTFAVLWLRGFERAQQETYSRVAKLRRWHQQSCEHFGEWGAFTLFARPQRYEGSPSLPPEMRREKTCRDCGLVQSQTWCEAYGHKFTEWYTIRDSRNGHDVYQARECEVCKQRTSRSVPVEPTPQPQAPASAEVFPMGESVAAALKSESRPTDPAFNGPPLS